MSMEYYAFVPRDALPTRAEWQDAITRLGFPILLDPGFDPGAASGFCRMSVDGKNAGCEIDTDLDSVAELAEACPTLDGKALEGAAVISFRFGGDMLAGACAFATAAALVQHHHAVFYDPQEDAVIKDAGELVSTAREFLSQQ